jgi:hypothetical protein
MRTYRAGACTVGPSGLLGDGTPGGLHLRVGPTDQAVLAGGPVGWREVRWSITPHRPSRS